MLAGNGTGDWQKKHSMVLCRLNKAGIEVQERGRQRSRGHVMSLAPAPSASRGDVVLQPSYFTSSVYVKALRDDISMLILRYHEVHSQPQSLGPFALFKSIWLQMGWHWLQFKVFDHRSRQTFLDVTMRLFLGLFSYFLFRFGLPSHLVLQRDPSKRKRHSRELSHYLGSIPFSTHR